jgi:hypothetical protein
LLIATPPTIAKRTSKITNSQSRGMTYLPSFGTHRCP